MKGNVKRIFVAVLALVLVVSFAGCGKDKVGYNEDGIYELVWYANDNPMPDAELVFEELSKYTREKIGVNVNYQAFTGAEYAEKMQLLYASGERIDVAFASTGTKFESYARQDAYTDMGPLLEKQGKGILELLPEYALDCFKVGGIQYGIPALKDWAFQPMFNGKAAMLEPVGMVDAWKNMKSYKDATPIIEAVANNEKANYGGKFYGILMRGNHNLFKFLPLETVTGSQIAGFTFDNFDKVVNVMETDEAKELFEEMRIWYNNGWIKSDAATSTSDKDIWAVGNYLSGHGEYLPYSELNAEGVDTGETIYALNVCQPRMSTTQITMVGTAIPATSGDPEKAMEFINMMYTDAYAKNLASIGIEGKHYIAVGETGYKLPDGIEKKADTGFDVNEHFLGNRYLLKTGHKLPADKWEKYQEFDEKAIKPETLGFSFDPKPVEGKIAAIANVYQEFFPALVTGSVDPATKLPEFINKLNSVGAADVIAEVQRQYDEWRANK